MQDPLGELQSVLVDTQVTQGANMVQSRTLELKQAGSREVLSVRLPDRTKPASLKYRERRIFKDGGIETEVFRDAVSTNLIVGIPAADVVTVTIKYLGPPLQSLGLNAIMLDLEYSAPDGDPKFDQSTSVLITDEASTQTQQWGIRLPTRQAKTYRWRMKLFFNSGLETGTEFKPDTRTLLVIRPPQP
jgi:hypothetical protein